MGTHQELPTVFSKFDLLVYMVVNSVQMELILMVD